MKVICLDLEGVLIPEIWIRVARHYQLDSLKLTTRDIPNYDKLMRYRLGILKKEGIRIQDIQRVIRKMKPLPGAKSVLKKLQRSSPVIILSDTFYEFAGPLMKQLDNPTLFCNWLKVNKTGMITGYVLRQKDGKTKAVCALKKCGFRVVASGDSYNDLGMLKEANQGVLFNPPESIRKKFRKYPVARNYNTFLRHLLKD